MSAYTTTVIVLLLLQACAGSSKNTTDTQDPADTLTQSKNDTIPKPEPPPVSDLAPAQAKVSGHITAVDSSTISLHIIEVLGYGSSMMPIGVNDTLVIQASGENGQNSMEFTEGVQTTLIIQRNIEAERRHIPTWSLIEILDN